MPITPPVATRLGSVWARRLTEPGWLLLPLRAFLGITFCYAGLQKLANPDYLNPHRPGSVAAQMRALQHSSPIGPLLGLSLHAPTLVGLLIAIGELAVGVGSLLDLYPRLAAAGGAALSLTFFLTVSWNTTPYYFGSDIVFCFAWLALFAVGDTGVLSVHSWVRNRARRGLRLGPVPADVRISAARLHALCPRAQHCGLQAAGHCVRARGCPVFPLDEPLPRRAGVELDRRTVVHTGAAAVIVAAGTALLGGLTAALGRLAGGPDAQHAVAGPLAGHGTPSTTAPAPHRSQASTQPSSHKPAGTAIGAPADVPLGQARSFTDPASGDPAWLVHPSGNTFVAFDAVCTHAGCPVQYDQANAQFACPCHGGLYDARTGQVLAGPPPAPLRRIPVRVVAGQLRVDR